MRTLRFLARAGARFTPCVAARAAESQISWGTGSSRFVTERSSMSTVQSGPKGTFWGTVGAHLNVKAPALIAPHQV
jgi:hypothetical protein